MELIREEENGGAERKREPCVWVLGESNGKKEKKKKKEKRGFICGYGAQAVGQLWVPQKVENIE